MCGSSKSAPPPPPPPPVAPEAPQVAGEAASAPSRKDAKRQRVAAGAGSTRRTNGLLASANTTSGNLLGG